MVTHVEPEPRPEDAAPDPAALLAAASELVIDQARTHPFRTLGIAFGVGYVLGGGVPSFVVRMATNAALRSASAGVLASGALAQLATRFVGAARPEPEPAPKNGHAKKRRAPRAR